NEDCTNCQAVKSAQVTPEPEPDAQAEATDRPGPQPNTPPPPSAASALPYANCLEDTGPCQHGSSPQCLVDDADHPTMGFCSSECVSAQDCPRSPAPSGALPSCLSLDRERGACVLDCSLGAPCPEGMVCLPFGVCGFVSEEALDP